MAWRTFSLSNGGRRRFIAKPWNPMGAWFLTRRFSIQLRANFSPLVSAFIIRAEYTG